MLRVLIIEDEVVIGMLLAQLLAAMGHEVTAVEGTEEGAVAAAGKARPDLILADERLRAGSGISAVERILRDGFIPHIWMSGAPTHRAILSRGVAELRKPFSELELELAIAQVTMSAAAMGAAGPQNP
ncbi:response regulator [Sediminicoccus sp. KRV36]|uniref:response regulator n=1 Tax=Sediminicoccus sp. KRV36 TaxID=3133721 RepID=UPI00200E89B0|nr:response regulator [Sediminicoccus rosea]UPY35630.1 response regulator [Sediminicoccus rosea]